MAGFKYLGRRNGDVPERSEMTIINSATIYKGSFGIASSGFITPATAGVPLYFFVEDIVTKEGGIPIDNAKLSEVNGAYTQGSEGVGKYVAAADNETVDVVKVRGFVVTTEDLFASVPDADIGTTTGSDLEGNYTDLASSIEVDENNASNSFTTKAQLLIRGTWENNSAYGLYSPAEVLA